MEIMELSEEEQAIYQKAQESLKRGICAVEFAKFFRQEGPLANLCANEEERKKMASSELYKWLQKELTALQSKEAELFKQKIHDFSTSKNTVKL